MYNKDDYSNAEPEEIVTGFRSVIYKIKKSWSKHRKEFENTGKKNSNNNQEYVGRALQLIRFIYKNLSPAVNNVELEERMVTLIFDKGEEAEQLLSKLMDTKNTKNKLVQEIIASLKEVKKLKSISLGLKNMQLLKVDCFVAQPKSFTISLKDRNLFINNYLIAKPHATGNNYEFISDVINQKPGTLVERKNLRAWLSDALNQHKDKRFVKILNDLHITGEIRNAFFPQVTDDSLIFRGPTVLKSTLEKEGVNVKALIDKLSENDLFNKE